MGTSTKDGWAATVTRVVGGASDRGNVLPQEEAASIERVKKGLKLLDDYLASRTFLVGHHVTLADIVAFANTYLGFTKVLLSHDLKRIYGSPW